MAAESIASALRSINAKIVAAAATRAAAGFGEVQPRLVAVSKTKPVEAIMEAYDAGHRHFGENYVQELVSKASELPADINWHFIGHLQTNKAKLIAGIPNLWLVESVDSAKLATSLNKECEKIGRESLSVLVQVNVSDEDTKSGVEPEEAVELVRHVVDTCPRLRFMGLMTIGRTGDTSTECFEILANVARTLHSQPDIAPALPSHLELSMGMSADFESAIAAGSTNVRIGSTVFGARSYPSKQPTSEASSETTVPQ